MYQTTPSPVTQQNSRLHTVCPECGIEIDFNRPPALQEVIYCIECDTNLEVVANYPLKLDWYFEEPFETDTFDDEMDWIEQDSFWEDDGWYDAQDDVWEEVWED